MQFVDMGSEHTKFVELEVYPGARSSGKAFKTPAAVLNCIHILSATHQSERGAPAHRQSFARSVRVRATSDHVGLAAASQASVAAAAKSSERGPRVHEIAADHRHTWLPYSARLPARVAAAAPAMAELHGRVGRHARRQRMPPRTDV